MSRRVRSVSGRLGAAFATMIGLLLLVSGTGVAGLVVTSAATARQVRLEHLKEANTGMLLAMANAETGVRGYRISQAQQFLQPYHEGQQDFPRYVAQAEALCSSERELELVHRQVALAHRWSVRFGDPVAAMPAGQVVVSQDDVVANKAVFDDLRTANADLTRLVVDQRRAAADRAEDVRSAALVVTAVAVALALALALVAAVRTRLALVVPLSALVGVLADLTAGLHSVRADAGSGPEEARAVARSVNALAEENDRLRAERAEAARLQRLGVQIGRSVRDHVVAEDSVQAAVSRLGEGLAVDWTHVRLLAGSRLGPVEQGWLAPGAAPPPEVASSTGEATWLEHLYAQRDLYCEPDLAAAAASDPATAALVERTGATSLLVVPVGAGAEPLGLISIAMSSGPRSWTPHEVALVQSVAADLGRALVLGRLYRQREDVVEQLRELDRTKSTFLATVSHELRTPLTSISGYLEIIRDGDAGEVAPQVDTMLGVVERNARRLRALIEDLLALSRIESGAFRMASEEVGVADLVSAVAAALGPVAAAGGVDLHVAVDAGDLVVVGDSGQLERVLLNLVSNAVKFTPAPGRVEVRASRSAGRAVLQVRDTGIGIPQHEQDQLFTRFFRASNATEGAVPGTGLGLTIVRSIVEQHGGDVTVRSEEGIGTTVVVRLPLVDRSGARPVAQRVAQLAPR